MRIHTRITALSLIAFHVTASGLAWAEENYGSATRYIGGDQSQKVSRAIRGKGEVWVVVKGGDRFKIKNPTAVPSGLRYGADGEDGEIPWQGLLAIQTRSSGAATGAQIGGLLLGLTGLAAGLVASQDCSGRAFTIEVCGAGPGDVLLVSAVGAGVGVILGAGIGALGTSYKTIYRSPGFIGLRPLIEPGGGRPVFGLEVRLAPGF
jgi:hypothetical protein